MATHPEEFADRAHLVIFYGIMLTEANINLSFAESVKNKIRWNLWLCMNDMRLLIEPREHNVQALLLLACRVQDFHQPSLCWMLASNACRMLQHLIMDTESPAGTRTALFWCADDIDKTLALIFGRAPNFPRSIYERMPVPSVNELMSFHPHTRNTGGLFGAHLVHQMFLCCRIQADVWHCVFERAPAQSRTQLRQTVEMWHQETQRLLNAATIAEQPLLTTEEQHCEQAGLAFTHFRYLYLSVLLTRSEQPNEECVSLSRRALVLLPSMLIDDKETYNGIMWQLFFQPFTPFFCLLDHVKSRAGGRADREQSLQAMEYLVDFLERVKQGHVLADRLVGLARRHMVDARQSITEAGEQTSAQSPSNPYQGVSTSAFDVGDLDPGNLIGAPRMFPHINVAPVKWS